MKAQNPSHPLIQKLQNLVVALDQMDALYPLREEAHAILEYADLFLSDLKATQQQLVQEQHNVLYTFDQFVEAGKQHYAKRGLQLVNGMPWAFVFFGCPVTHENDQKYFIQQDQQTLTFTDQDVLMVTNGGLSVLAGQALANDHVHPMQQMDWQQNELVNVKLSDEEVEQRKPWPQRTILSIAQEAEINGISLARLAHIMGDPKLELALKLTTPLERMMPKVAEEREQGDRICEEADGCPIERAVLQRHWRAHKKNTAHISFWWACIEAETKLAGETIGDADVVLNFSGSGASAQVTAGDLRKLTGVRIAV
jgi:hypothetical protein